MTYAVIGVGTFGSSVAKGLLKQNLEVIIIDRNEKKVSQFRNEAQQLYIFDATDVEALKEAGIANVDTAIVSIGENVEASILTVMALKEIGVKEIIAKAITTVHGKILSHIGVSRIIYPESDSARRLVRNIVENPRCEMFEITTTLKMAKLIVSDKLIEHKVADILAKVKNTVNIVALKHDGEWNYHVEKDHIIKKGKVLIAGKKEGIDEFIRLF